MQLQENGRNEIIDCLMCMEDVEVLAHCLIFDDVWVENNMIVANMYTVFKKGTASQSTAFLL